IASAGMPCSAAAFVTSGSLAAPSSIEYSVWTCRCANESVLLTGDGAPQWSCVPDRRELRQATGGEDRQGCVLGVRLFGLLLPILAPPEVYSEGLTGRVSSHRTDPSHAPPGLLLVPGGLVREEAAPHGDVCDSRLLVLVADGRVAG